MDEEEKISNFYKLIKMYLPEALKMLNLLEKINEAYETRDNNILISLEKSKEFNNYASRYIRARIGAFMSEDHYAVKVEFSRMKKIVKEFNNLIKLLEGTKNPAEFVPIAIKISSLLKEKFNIIDYNQINAIKERIDSFLKYNFLNK